MEQQQQRVWVSLSFLVVAVLTAVVFFVSGMKLSALWDIEAKVRNIELILRVGALVAGGIVFLVLSRRADTQQFMGEVVEELARVTWPTQRETSNATVVVVVMVIISGLILGLLDFLCTKLIQAVL